MYGTAINISLQVVPVWTSTTLICRFFHGFAMGRDDYKKPRHDDAIFDGTRCGENENKGSDVR